MSKEYNVELKEEAGRLPGGRGPKPGKSSTDPGDQCLAVLSQYRRSVYDKGDIGEVEKKLEEFFRIKEEQARTAGRRSPSGPACRDTSLHPYRKRPTS